MKNIIRSLLVALTLLAATNVRGALVDLEVSYYMESPYLINLQIQGVPHYTAATAFSATWRGGDALPDGHSIPFLTFCLDMNKSITSGWWQSGAFDDPVLTAQSSPAIRQPNSLYRAANLYNHFSAGIMNSDGTWANKLDGAALQLSIWEVLYETDSGFDVYTGEGFKVTKGTSAVMDRANQMLHSDYSAISDVYQGTFWNAVTQDGLSRSSQDLIGPSTIVPEPSSTAVTCFLTIPILLNVWRHHRRNKV